MKETLMNGVSGRSAFLIRLFGTLLALVLLLYLLSQQGWSEIAAAFKKIPYWRLALAIGLMFISRLAVSLRWYILLRSGGVDVSPGQAMRVNFAGLFATNFLPTTVGGDVIRLAGALQLHFDAAVSAASLIVDRLVGMAGMAMVLPFGLPSFLQRRPATTGWLWRDPYLMASYAAPLGKLWHTAWEKGMRLVRKMLTALSLWLKQPRALLLALGLTWVHMLCLFLILRTLFTGMDQSISFWLVGGLYSLVYFVTLIPFSINGYGIQEVSMTLIFSTVGGVTMESGLTAALLFRTMMMLASLPGAIFVPELLAGEKARTGAAR
jgi:uncharacterized membrane protein YbhN (UPF0104 family)